MKYNTGKLQVTLPSDREIQLTREFAAPRQLVFDAQTKPAMVKHWLFGPDGWSMPECIIDLRVGGRYHYVWRHTDGRSFGTGGSFVEIVSPARIVSTEKFDDAPHPGEALNTMVLHEEAGVTRLTLTMRFPSNKIRDLALKSGLNDGVELGFARLDRIFGSTKVRPPRRN